MAMWPFFVSLLGLAIGAAMGGYAMLNPRWAARLVRLNPDPERPGGAAEFRATYGGLFLAGHLVAAYFLWTALAALRAAEPAGAALAAVMVAPACAIPASLWLGTAAGRLLAVLVDGVGGRFNSVSLAFELCLGLAIACPLLVFPLGG